MVGGEEAGIAHHGGECADPSEWSYNMRHGDLKTAAAALLSTACMLAMTPLRPSTAGLPVIAPVVTTAAANLVRTASTASLGDLRLLVEVPASWGPEINPEG